MKAFLCCSNKDGEFVVQIAKHLRLSMADVFCFMDSQRSTDDFVSILNKKLRDTDVFIVFVGESFSTWQQKELHAVIKKNPQPEMHVVFIGLSAEKQSVFYNDYPLAVFNLAIDDVTAGSEKEAYNTATRIMYKLNIPYRHIDDLPRDPHLFSYEKDVIDFFKEKYRFGAKLYEEDTTSDQEAERKRRSGMREKLKNGCPAFWPEVVHWEEMINESREQWPGIRDWREKPYENQLQGVGAFRKAENNVVVAALTKYHRWDAVNAPAYTNFLIDHGLLLPEAGPRKDLYFPPLARGNAFNVAILVSGGIAPGINAVIDGIVQRHWLYVREHNQQAGLTVYGLLNGFQAFESFPNAYYHLVPDHDAGLNSRTLVTSAHANKGGSILGTSRVDDLINVEERIPKLKGIVNILRTNHIDILYVIGGDGSMKAAHALFSIAKNKPGRPLSVVAIPKTMDNDVLWVWQAFGFLSAVEKAREIIEQLHTEVSSNPRLCILQLFGSDSGFVVSHSVLASATGHCDVALIPEVPFSMAKLAKVLKEKMCERGERIPRGLIVLAETAIPVDAINYAAPEGERPKIDIGLSRSEQEEILRFESLRKDGRRIQGQTSDNLRVAGLKIVSRGLPKLLPFSQLDKNLGFEPDWNKMRVLTNEPRHLLRAIPPSCSDIIFGQRLGVLAVDNAMAGNTNFMISQWLTEYVLVPMKLVVLGRKRIPKDGIFWKSVLAKTGQPEDMV